jgi:ATP-dependent helicase IRC3
MRFALRDYQKEAIQSAIQARKEGLKRILICLPTGAGKTVIFSELCRLANRKVLVLAHREELLYQARKKILIMTGGTVEVGIEQGNLSANNNCSVVVSSIRSLREERLNSLQDRFDFGLIIYDECHHAAAEDNVRILRQLGVFQNNWTGTLIGFTATTTRGDGIGLETVFEAIVYELRLLELIKQGYLVPLRGYRINTDIDLYNILGTSIDEVSDKVDIESRNALVARSVQELARDRRTIVFCVSVKHAINVAKSLNNLGVKTGVVYGEMPKEKRVKTLELFRKEKLMCITNVMVLTEGFDDPGVSCIAIARPTKSEGLYAQCVGRGARLAPNKDDCLILDFVDLSDLSLVNLPSLVGLPKEINLNGLPISEAVELYYQLQFDFPGFELEAGEITLTEIKTRAEAFDPLTMELHPEITAITTNGWFSLGQKGLALHYFSPNGSLQIAEVLRNKGKRSQRYQIEINGEKRAHFSRIIDAIEAVDYEIEQMGSLELQTARDDAIWRTDTVPHEISQMLKSLRPPRKANNLADALGYLVFAKHHFSRTSRPIRNGWPTKWKSSKDV